MPVGPADMRNIDVIDMGEIPVEPAGAKVTPMKSATRKATACKATAAETASTKTASAKTATEMIDEKRCWSGPTIQASFENRNVECEIAAVEFRRFERDHSVTHT